MFALFVAMLFVFAEVGVFLHANKLSDIQVWSIADRALALIRQLSCADNARSVQPFI
jgi:hypothetical protein